MPAYGSVIVPDEVRSAVHASVLVVDFGPSISLVLCPRRMRLGLDERLAVDIESLDVLVGAHHGTEIRLWRRALAVKVDGSEDSLREG